jgi:hypothetical protein
MTTATEATTHTDDVLAALEQERATLPAPDHLPLNITPVERDRIEGRRSHLTNRITGIRSAMSVLTDVEPRLAECLAWKPQLEDWKHCLLAEPVPEKIRTALDLGRLQNTRASLAFLQHGTSLDGTGWMLPTSHLGKLMKEAGYVESLPLPGQACGELPWFGSLDYVNAQIADLTKRRDAAQAQLRESLLDDSARAERAAADAERLVELRARPNRKVRGDGSVYDKYPDGRIVEVS